MVGIGWMFFNQEGGQPQKIEWDEVKQLWLADDIKEVTYIRNEYEGHVTVKPDKLDKYSDKFAGNLPKSSPHFVFSSQEGSMLRKCSVNSMSSFLLMKK